MAKFDRASLLLALCVTVIISPWMPLSQCVFRPTDYTPPITWAECEEWANKLHRQVNDELPEIFSEKLQLLVLKPNNLFAENVCNPKQEIWKNQINKIAEDICNPKQERVEQDSKGQCNLKCKHCQKALLPSDVVGYLYEKVPDIRSFQERICKNVKKPSPKEDDWKQRFKTRVVGAGQKLKGFLRGFVGYRGTRRGEAKQGQKSYKHEL